MHMGRPIGSDYFKSDEEIEASIAKKLRPFSIGFMEMVAKSMDSFFARVKDGFAITDEEFQKELDQYGQGDLIQYYKDNPLFTCCSELLLVAGRPDIKNQIETNLLGFLLDIFRNKVAKSTPEQEAAGKANITPERIFRIRALFRAGMIDGYCTLHHKKRMFEILKDALSGKDEALFLAISVDKALLSDKTISARYIKESLAANVKFLEQVSKAIATPIELPNSTSWFKMFTLLSITPIIPQFKNITDEEMSILFKKLAIYDIKPGALRTTRHRMGLVRSQKVPVDYDKMLLNELPFGNNNEPA